MDLGSVKAHYERKMAQGQRPEGVDWGSAAAQDDRLKALALLVSAEDKPYSLNDWGCGYRRALNFFSPEKYYGYDLNAWDEATIIADAPSYMADYTIASGTFNVIGFRWWEPYVIDCIKTMDNMSRKGFGFNLLHNRSDRQKTGLFYTDPAWAIKHLPKGRVSILEYYSPWDFTILVNKC